MTRMVRIQLVVFTALTITAVILITFVYLRVPTLIGIGQMDVTAELTATGGVYPNANVTYRGFTVGKVKSVDITPTGVEAKMSIDESQAPPANSLAEVHSVNAVGEQYIDFVPGPGPAPPLEDGAVLPVTQTSVPVPVADVLNGAQSLLASVDPKQLTTVLNEANDAFRGLGPDLGQLVDSTASLARLADQNYGPTRDLIHQAPRLLDSQTASAGGLRAWTSELASFSAQLKASDGALRGVLDNVPPAAQHLDGFVKDLSTTAPTFLSSSNTMADLAKAYNVPIEQVLVVYPALIATNDVLNPKGEEQTTRFNLMSTINRQQCNVGWADPGKPGGPRPGTELSDEPLPNDSYCKLPQNDDAVVRGARNLPCFEPGSPPGRRAATIEQCTGDGFTPGASRGTTRVGDPLKIGGTPLPGFQGPNPGPLAGTDPAANPWTMIGASGSPAPPPGAMTWQTLMDPGGK